MNIKAIMEMIRSDMAAHLPTLFQDCGTNGVVRFVVGYPSNQELAFCCIRIASINEKPEKSQLEFIIHLAIPGVSELDSYGYIQAVMDYLDKIFDESAYGFDTGSYEFQVFETEFLHGDIQILFIVTLDRNKDDCD